MATEMATTKTSPLTTDVVQVWDLAHQCIRLYFDGILTNDDIVYKFNHTFDTDMWMRIVFLLMQSGYPERMDEKCDGLMYLILHNELNCHTDEQFERLFRTIEKEYLTQYFPYKKKEGHVREDGFIYVQV